MASGIGSYNYKGNWGWLDQIIVSKNFYQPNIKLLSIGAFQRDFMLIKIKMEMFIQVDLLVVVLGMEDFQIICQIF